MNSININGRLMTFQEPKVMGILNCTPDSFSDGNMYNSVEKAIKKVQEMISNGVHILDIGAASSRPGAKATSAKEEISRIHPILNEIKNSFPNLPISIDTYHREVAEYAINKGAHIINDISAWEIDNSLLDFMAESKVPYILMHMRGNPQNMQAKIIYENVVSEVVKFFVGKLRELEKRSIHDVVIDPGFGFGKGMEDNYEMLGRLSVFNLLEKPIMVGVSRKSMIHKLLKVEPMETLAASTALHLQSLMNGASILRVHDVKEAIHAIKLYKMLKKYN